MELISYYSHRFHPHSRWEDYRRVWGTGAGIWEDVVLEFCLPQFNTDLLSVFHLPPLPLRPLPPPPHISGKFFWPVFQDFPLCRNSFSVPWSVFSCSDTFNRPSLSFNEYSLISLQDRLIPFATFLAKLISPCFSMNYLYSLYSLWVFKKFWTWNI